MTHETLPIDWTSSVTNVMQWLHGHQADRKPMALTDPLCRWGIAQHGQERFAVEPGDTLCWNGTCVWLHSSRRQEVETCEAKETRMLKKFGTGQITNPDDTNPDDTLTVQASRALTSDEAAALLTEGREEETTEE
ncbi:hypothetical protein [Streptomyces sp. NPDC018055]|uniref:hypothetical protein n=1 Tax=Streptomyces sp. NPDC018055 TaxID=3365038 RepID=UPI0037AB09DD